MAADRRDRRGGPLARAVELSRGKSSAQLEQRAALVTTALEDAHGPARAAASDADDLSAPEAAVISLQAATH